MSQRPQMPHSPYIISLPALCGIWHVNHLEFNPRPRGLDVATVISFGAAAAGEPKVLCHKCELNIRIKCPFDAVRD